jgi:hypothetical protein
MKKTTTKLNPAPATTGASPEAQASALLKQLEQERGQDTLSMGTAVKGYSTREKIFEAAPEVQVEFVRLVVATIAKLGKSKGKIPMVSAWFNDLKVPFAAEEVAKQLMRRRLPFTDQMLFEMLEQIGRMDFIGFAPALEPLTRELEKRRKETGLPPKIRKALPRIVNGLLVKGWPAAAIDNWGLPAAADRKLAARLQQLVR